MLAVPPISSVILIGSGMRIRGMTFWTGGRGEQILSGFTIKASLYFSIIACISSSDSLLIEIISLLRSVFTGCFCQFDRRFSIVSWIWFKQSSMCAERFSIPSAHFSRFLSSVICSVTPCFSARSVSFSAGAARCTLFRKC